MLSKLLESYKMFMMFQVVRSWVHAYSFKFGAWCPGAIAQIRWGLDALEHLLNYVGGLMSWEPFYAHICWRLDALDWYHMHLHCQEDFKSWSCIFESKSSSWLSWLWSWCWWLITKLFMMMLWFYMIIIMICWWCLCC
jgi:hypothetical protein